MLFSLFWRGDAKIKEKEATHEHQPEEKKKYTKK
jgi:hypothetical protein